MKNNDKRVIIFRLWKDMGEILLSVDKDESIDQKKLDDFGKQWIAAFSWPNMPLYLHVLICHYNDKLIKFKSLKCLSQEGTESHHTIQKKIQQRSTAQGGGRKKKEVSQQILETQYRSIIMENYEFRIEDEFVYYEVKKQTK
jgi:hypothetical protein